MGECAFLYPVCNQNTDLSLCKFQYGVGRCRERIQTPHIVPICYLLLLHSCIRSDNYLCDQTDYLPKCGTERCNLTSWLDETVFTGQ